MRRGLNPSATPKDHGLKIDMVSDPSIRERLRELEDEADAGFLEEIIEIYLKHSKGVFEKLKETIQLGDGKAIVFHAHSLRGSSLNVGARRLAELCKIIETDAGKGVDPAPTSLADIEHAYEAAVKELRTFLGSR